MTVTALNGVKVYNLAAGKKLPAWLPEQKRRALLKEDEGYARRIQLLQDFDFSTASQDIKMSSDGLYICACGVYPPQVKVYDVQDLGMKFERHMDAEVVAFDVLSEDWSKMVFLQVDRTLEFHAAYGRHYRTRVPKFGRCMAYYAPGAELLVGGAGDEVYRLNLEEGRFMAPYT
ncbi:nol10, partial [Symbiodinium sp. KB8]